MIELLQFTGPKGYLLLLLGGLGAASAVGSLALAGLSRNFRPSLMLAGLTLGLGVSAMLMGVIGRSNDVRSMYSAVAHVNPADRQMILEGGKREAQANVTLGTMVSLPLVLLALGAIGLSFARTGESA